MRFILGGNAYLKRTEGRDVPVAWDSGTAVNPHMLLVGGSGAGKTHTLRRLVRAMAETGQGARLHVFDVHGDIALPGASSAKFSESTRYGQNPLEIDPDPDAGGVRRRIQSLVAALGRTSRPLGSRQEAVLRSLLTDLYAANGFYPERPESWRLDDGIARKHPKKHPTLQDAARFGAAKLKALYLGGDAGAAAALERVNARARAGRFLPRKCCGPVPTVNACRPRGSSPIRLPPLPAPRQPSGGRVAERRQSRGARHFVENSARAAQALVPGTPGAALGNVALGGAGVWFGGRNSAPPTARTKGFSRLRNRRKRPPSRCWNGGIQDYFFNGGELHGKRKRHVGGGIERRGRGGIAAGG